MLRVICEAFPSHRYRLLRTSLGRWMLLWVLKVVTSAFGHTAAKRPAVLLTGVTTDRTSSQPGRLGTGGVPTHPNLSTIPNGPKFPRLGHRDDMARSSQSIGTVGADAPRGTPRLNSPQLPPKSHVMRLLHQTDQKRSRRRELQAHKLLTPTLATHAKSEFNLTHHEDLPLTSTHRGGHDLLRQPSRCIPGHDHQASNHHQTCLHA